MATIILTKQQQSQLGKRSEKTTSIHRYRLRVLAHQQSKDDDFHLDSCPDLSDRLQPQECRKGTRIVETIAPYRQGTIVKVQSEDWVLVRWKGRDGMEQTYRSHLAPLVRQLSLF